MIEDTYVDPLVLTARKSNAMDLVDEMLTSVDAGKRRDNARVLAYVDYSKIDTTIIVKKLARILETDPDVYVRGMVITVLSAIKDNYRKDISDAMCALRNIENERGSEKDPNGSVADSARRLFMTEIEIREEEHEDAFRAFEARKIEARKRAAMETARGTPVIEKPRKRLGSG